MDTDEKALTIPCELTFDPHSGELRTMCSVEALTALMGYLRRTAAPTVPAPEPTESPVPDTSAG